MADLNKLAEEIVGLTLLQAQELKTILKDKYGIEPAAGGAVMVAGPAAGGAPAEAAEEKTDFDVVLTDLHMAGMDGITLCKRAAESRPDVPVVVLTAFGSIESAVEAIRAGAYDYITKPVEIEALALTPGSPYAITSQPEPGIDRADARCNEVLNEVFDLFIDLDADEQALSVGLGEDFSLTTLDAAPAVRDRLAALRLLDLPGECGEPRPPHRVSRRWLPVVGPRPKAAGSSGQCYRQPDCAKGCCV